MAIIDYNVDMGRPRYSWAADDIRKFVESGTENAEIDYSAYSGKKIGKSRALSAQRTLIVAINRIGYSDIVQCVRNGERIFLVKR